MNRNDWKVLILIATITAVSVMSWAGFSTAADEMKGDAAAGTEKAMTPEEQAMMKKFEEFSTPGEAHRVLDPMVGTWDFKIKSWMDASAMPEESTGTSEMAWDLNGHFLKQTVTSSMMGQPFTGTGYLGYNNLKKEYESIWLDSMSTGIMKGSGKYDAATKSITSKGDFTCPLVEGNRKYREVTKFDDADHITHEMYSPGKDGKEFKMMEIKYTRQKS